jgi:hypothetical protein
VVEQAYGDKAPTRVGEARSSGALRSCLAAIWCWMGRESLVDSWAPVAGGPFVPTP